MGRSQESFGKKQVKTRQEKKRKEKEQKRENRKIGGKKSRFEDMIAYVDEFGRITSTPPDPDKKSVIEAESIEISVTRNSPEYSPDPFRRGVVTMFNESKGFGFIRDLETNQNIFVHAKNLMEPVKENNLVVFETGRGPKGLYASNVRLAKE